MKVAIIGAGNMGGAIARGLAQGTIIPASDVTVADPFSGNLETLQADYPEIRVTTENPKAIEDADIVILTLGGKHGTCSMASMGEGVDATNINLPECQDAFIRKAAKLGKPLIGVHFDGRPISMQYWRLGIRPRWGRRQL